MVGAGPEAADVRDRLALEAKARLARNALADLEEQLENCVPPGWKIYSHAQPQCQSYYLPGCSSPT